MNAIAVKKFDAACTKAVIDNFKLFILSDIINLLSTSCIVSMNRTMGVLFIKLKGSNKTYTLTELEDLYIEVEDDEEPTELMFPYEFEVADKIDTFLNENSFTELLEFECLNIINKAIKNL